jgi:hypothetical protein
MEAKLGELDAAREHLARAVELRPELEKQAQEDEDLTEVVA